MAELIPFQLHLLQNVSIQFFVTFYIVLIKLKRKFLLFERFIYRTIYTVQFYVRVCFAGSATPFII